MWKCGWVDSLAASGVIAFILDEASSQCRLTTEGELLSGFPFCSWEN